MKKILSLLTIFLILSLSGCTKDISSQINDVVKKHIESIPNYHIKKISYLKTKNAVVDEVKYNDIYIIEVSSKDSSDYNINLILDENINILTSSNYILNPDNTINYVYKMSIMIDGNEIDDDMYTNLISE